MKLASAILLAMCCAYVLASASDNSENNAGPACEYDNWSSWSRCSKKCGGVQRRKKEPLYDNDACASVVVQKRRCDSRKSCIRPADKLTYSWVHPSPTSRTSYLPVESPAPPSQPSYVQNLAPELAADVVQANNQALNPNTNLQPPSSSPTSGEIVGLPTIAVISMIFGGIALAVIFIVGVLLFRKVPSPIRPKPKKKAKQESPHESSHESYDTDPNTPELTFSVKQQALARGSRGLVVGKEGKTFAYTAEELHSLQL